MSKSKVQIKFKAQSPKVKSFVIGILDLIWHLSLGICHYHQHIKKNVGNRWRNLGFENPPRGVVLMLSLVFIGLFAISSLGIVSMVSSQQKYTRKKIDYNQALQIAEAGVNYYRWHLAHAPTDYQDGTGVAGPYVHDYIDPYGARIGQFSLEVTPPGANCHDAVTITSSGWTDSSPLTKRKIRVKYGMQALAQFAFLTDSNVWFGDGEEIHGELHSNGGIRMDGSHDSLVSSAKTTYICGSEHGCSNVTKPGVWGTGGNQQLWEFPVPAVDFNIITAALPSLKATAQGQGLYYSGSSLGYHVQFRSDGKIDVYRVTRLRNPVSLYNGERWVSASYDIQTKTFVETKTLPNGCATIFMDGNTWVDGTVNGKALLVAATLPDTPSTNRNAIIQGNLVYLAKDGSSSLGIIAQKDLVVPLYAAPQNLEINAVLLAQKGRVSRFYYTSSHSPYHLRNSLTLYGAIITKKVWTWSWVNGSGTIISGYQTTNTTYDPNLTYNPPPGFPVQGDFQILKWEDATEK